MCTTNYHFPFLFTVCSLAWLLAMHVMVQWLPCMTWGGRVLLVRCSLTFSLPSSSVAVAHLSLDRKALRLSVNGKETIREPLDFTRFLLEDILAPVANLCSRLFCKRSCVVKFLLALEKREISFQSTLSFSKTIFGFFRIRRP